MAKKPPKQGEMARIAYFTMEVGISHTLHTYAGGLGVLAGDTLKTYADMGLPVVGVTLLNSHGYFYQQFDPQGNQIETPVRWAYEDLMEKAGATAEVQLEGRAVKVGAWKLLVNGQTGRQIPVYFLDTDLEGNSEYDRELTAHLYGGDRRYRLSQEVVLGIGGVRLLRALGYSQLRKYHMNEGHAALLAAELLRASQKEGEGDELYDHIDEIREMCVFTTHTPVAAGHDRFELPLFKQVVGDAVPNFMLESATDDGQVNMTLLGLNSSKYINGVAKMHGQVARQMFPEYSIDSITNGIHVPSWACPEFSALYDRFVPGWKLDPHTLRNVLSVPKADVWDAHYGAKRRLIDRINSETNAGFHLDRFTIGYARRFTAYKRPNLLLKDIGRLKKVAENVGDMQIVYAGKAHPDDTEGKEMIRKTIQLAAEINDGDSKIKLAFLRNYDMSLAKLMVGGSDVWLNTPKQPREASGTSGMKAALNGVPHFSTLDGWWLEGHIENITGWSIGGRTVGNGGGQAASDEEEAKELYSKLENSIIPRFYKDRSSWTDMMKHCIAINASFFNTARMAQQYIINAYME